MTKIQVSDYETLLCWLYWHIDEAFKTEAIAYSDNRLSPNQTVLCTDAELVCCALFGLMIGQKNMMDCHRLIKRQYRSYFPQLPCYSVFNRRLKRLEETYYRFYEWVAAQPALRIGRIASAYLVMDSCPIALSRRPGRVAHGYAQCDYCASKKAYYYGVRLHGLCRPSQGRVAIAEHLVIEPADKHDLTVARERLFELEEAGVLGDKAYCSMPFADELERCNQVNLVTPIKKKKGVEFTLFERAFNSVFSSFRQPVESFFAWVQRKTNIQDASLVRSFEGMCKHIHLRLLATLLSLFVQF